MLNYNVEKVNQRLTIMGKLNEFLRVWPGGTVVVQSWLEERHIARQLSQKYVKGGWVEKIGQGAYIRSGDRVNWRGGIYALQQQLQLPIHVGGKTSLDLLGRGHFIPLGDLQHLYLYTNGSDPKRQLPKWLAGYFKLPEIYYVPTVLFSSNLGLQKLDCATFEITISGTERALLEILSLVPKQVSLEHAFLLLQGQETLRADLLQKLLEDCKVQVLKRLFLYLAKKCQLPVVERLNLSTIDLGQGKRKIGNGNHYDPEFKLLMTKLDQQGGSSDEEV